MNSNKSSSGLGCTGVLTIIFVVLKLTNLISWSWLWVLSPIWISILLVGLIIAFAAIANWL
jgi:hypothetical protein